MMQVETGRVKNELPPVAGLFLLCLLWSSSSLRGDLFPAFPRSNAPMQGEAIALGLFALAALVGSLLRQVDWPHKGQMIEAVVTGAGLFTAPAMLVSLAGAHVNPLVRTALFSLTPVFAVVLAPHIGDASSTQNDGVVPRGAMLAALAAVVGMFLIFPLDMGGSMAAAGGFGAIVLASACIAAANCVGVRTACAAPGRSVLPFAAVACATAAILQEAFAIVMEQSMKSWNSILPIVGWSAAVDAPALLLLFWLMARMSAVRMTTRFVLAPLMTVLISILWLRPEIALRTWIGIAIVAAGAGWLLWARAPNNDAEDSSLNLDRS